MVSCSPDFQNEKRLTFRVFVGGGNPNAIPSYSWTVSGGKIVDGQGSFSITVDTVGFGAFTGTVNIAGYDVVCPATASCSLIIEDLPNSIRFDSYGKLSRQKEISRLNAFAVQLQQQPGAQGYLLVYGERGHDSEVQKAATRSQEYLVKTRGIEVGRIVIVKAGVREKLTIDLWLVSLGANPPVPEPTITPSEVKITKDARTEVSKHN